MKKFTVSFLLSLVVLSICYVAFGDKLFSKNQPIGPKDLVETYPETDDFVPTEDNEIKRQHPDELVFALFGVDGNGVKREKGLRSDVIIVSKLNFKTGAISLLQIHRDARVPVQGSMDKINSAHSYGGPRLAMRTLREYLGIDVDYYVKVDFKGIMDIVESVGGVEFDVPCDMNYDDPTAKPPLRIHLKKGRQVLNGKNSHDLLRFRHNNRQDFYPANTSREEVQLQWLKAFIGTVLQPKNILKLPSIVKSAYDSVDTNIDFFTIAECALDAGKLDASKVEMKSVPGDGKMINLGNGHRGWFFIPDEKGKEEVVREMFGDYLLKR